MHTATEHGNSIATRADALDWQEIATELNQHGCALLPGLLRAQECDALAQRYARDELYRSRVVMARHGFGRGEYKYYCYPLPEPVGTLREVFYARLALQANRWNEAMGIDVRYPPHTPTSSRAATPPASCGRHR